MHNTNDIGQTIVQSLNNTLFAVINFIPKFIAGTIVLLIGIVIGALLKQVVLEILKAVKFETYLRRYGVPEVQRELNWSNIIAELVRWFVIIVFLIPTAEIWSLPQIVTVLDRFLFYLPNVFVAAIIALIGFVLAKLAHDVVFSLTRELSPETSRTIATVTHWAIIIFVILAVLNQLGVASDLIKILFTGFVAMVAIAGGLAFGLGGQETAKDILEGIRKRLK